MYLCTLFRTVFLSACIAHSLLYAEKYFFDTLNMKYSLFSVGSERVFLESYTVSSYAFRNRLRTHCLFIYIVIGITRHTPCGTYSRSNAVIMLSLRERYLHILYGTAYFFAEYDCLLIGFYRQADKYLIALITAGDIGS